MTKINDLKDKLAFACSQASFNLRTEFPDENIRISIDTEGDIRIDVKATLYYPDDFASISNQINAQRIPDLIEEINDLLNPPNDGRALWNI